MSNLQNDLILEHLDESLSELYDTDADFVFRVNLTAERRSDGQMYKENTEEHVENLLQDLALDIFGDCEGGVPYTLADVKAAALKRKV